MEKKAKLFEIVEFLNDFCKISEIKDFSPARNGLQFENSGIVTRIAAAVDAGGAEIETASKLGADLLIAHHGLFWGETIPVVDFNYQKTKTLIDFDMAVYAVHLPLDANDLIGNNVMIAKALKLKIVGRCFEHEGTAIGVIAEAPKEGRPELESRLKNLFPKTYKEILFGSQMPKKIAICSGSCGDAVPYLRDIGVDTLVCGELRQRHFSMALDMKLNLYPCGHYATECFGIAALGELVSKKFGLPCDFIEMNNPL
mgnify:CR=1 FL=1